MFLVSTCSQPPSSKPPAKSLATIDNFVSPWALFFPGPPQSCKKSFAIISSWMIKDLKARARPTSMGSLALDFCTNPGFPYQLVPARFGWCEDKAPLDGPSCMALVLTRLQSHFSTLNQAVDNSALAFTSCLHRVSLPASRGESSGPSWVFSEHAHIPLHAHDLTYS